MSGSPPLPGLPRFDRAKADTGLQALGLYLQFLGEEKEYDFLMGVSGNAFKLYWNPMPLWCPSVTRVSSEDPFVRVADALGYETHRQLNADLPTAVEQIRRVLEAGRPVLTCNLFGESEWSLIVGLRGEIEYRPGDEPDEPDYPVVTLEVRSPFDPGDDYRVVETPAWNGYLLGPLEGGHWGRMPLFWLGDKREPPPREEVLRAALARAARLAQERQYERYAAGLRAYEMWAEMLAADEEFEGLDRAEMQRRAFENGYLFYVLIDARRAASRFLSGALRYVPENKERLLKDAAAQYAACAGSLEDAYRLLPFPRDAPLQEAYDIGVKRLSDPANRHRAADLLLAARDQEEWAADLLRRAVS